MKSETVQFATPGEMKDFYSALIQQCPTLPQGKVRRYLKNKRQLRTDLEKLFESMSEYADQLLAWQKLYSDCFGLDKDFSGLVIPEKQEGFDRLIVVAAGTTPQKGFDACTKMFQGRTWKYESGSLDDAVPTHDRVADKDYAIWVRDVEEADEDLKNRSANDLAAASISTETLPERELHELIFFRETGRHLDVKNVTLCAGSRGSGGSVPDVGWGGDGLCVSWCGPARRGDYLRARAVIS